MIKYIEGDIFKSPAQVIVNTVNTVGVMGKGIALSFKQRYPKMFEQYKKVCDKHQLTIGKLMLVYEADYWLLLFPTKESWRNPSKIEYIEKGLMKFVQTYADKGITSAAFPKLGCGNGGLDWKEVKPLMEKYLNKLPIDIYIYLDGAPAPLGGAPASLGGAPTDSVPEHQTRAKDMSFSGIKEDIILSSSILPYTFKMGTTEHAEHAEHTEYEVKWDKGLKFTEKGTNHAYEITEDDLFMFWDKIRRDEVFSSEKLSEAEKLVSGLLCDKGYLSQAKILNEKTQKMEEGYQLNGGLRRSSSLMVA